MIPDIIIDLGFIHTSVVELIAVIFGLASVWLVKKESVWGFPVGAVNVLIYVFICFSAKLYAYAGINVFYFLMGMYGLYNWIRKTGSDDHIPITRCRPGERWIYVGLILVFFAMLYLMLKRFTDSTVPVWDSVTTSIYIIAMWLMARKRIEHWLLWIIGDLISIWLFAYEQLFFSSFQYMVFTVIALLGWREWRKKIRVLIPGQ